HQFGNEQEGDGLALDEGGADVLGGDYAAVISLFIQDDEVGCAREGREVENALERVGNVDGRARLQVHLFEGDSAEQRQVAGAADAHATEAQAHGVDLVGAGEEQNSG